MTWKDEAPEVVLNTVRALGLTIAYECARDRDPAKQRRSLKAIPWYGSVRGGVEESVFTVTSANHRGTAYSSLLKIY